MDLFRSCIDIGSGYIFSAFIIDVVFFTATTYLIWSLIPLYKQRSTSTKLQKLAGSPPKHWFYGHLTHYSIYASGFQWLVDKTSQFPVMMNLWYTPFLSILYVHHPDSASAYVNSGAPKNESNYRMIRPLLGDGLLLSSGKKWHRNRRLLTPAFHYGIKQYAGIFNYCARFMLNSWGKKVEQNIEISQDISLMTLDAMLKCAMSSDMNPQESGIHHYLKAMDRFQELLIDRIKTPLHHFDWIYNLSKSGRESKKCVKILHDCTEKIIQKRKLDLINKNKQSIEQLGNSRGKVILDFLDMLLLTRDEDGTGLSDLEIRDEVDTFLFAGHDTTGSGIQWALHNLAKYPKLQKKCRQEINKVVGDKNIVEWSDLSKLKYLTMFIKESLRLKPPVYAIGRLFDKVLDIHHSTKKGGISTIPAESPSFLSIYSLHRNPLVWKNPEIFDPERFNKENSSKRSNYAFLPFSAGSRNCIGQNFAMIEMKIVLAQTIRRFDLSIRSDTPESRVLRKVTLQSESGIHVYIENAKV